MAVLDDKVAIVTGSARGIGRATAEILSEQGAKVLINDLDGDVAEQTASEISGDTLVFGGDLTKPGVPDELVQKVVDEWGRVDILVNNAGYTLDAPIHKMSDEWFQKMLDIHSIVPFRMCRAVAPHMREPAKKEKEEGREVFRKIVNVTSISGTMGNAGQANYSSGKAAVTGLTQDARQGVGPVQDQRERGRVRLHRDSPDGVEGRGERRRDRWREGAARDPRPAPRHGFDADPAGATRHASGGRQRGLPAVLTVGQLHPRPDRQRHRRPVLRDVHRSAGRGRGCERSRPRC